MTVRRNIGIFALSSPFDRPRFEAGLRILEDRGLNPVVHPGIFERDGYLAGSDEARLEALQALLDRPDVPILMAARGGYGVHRVLDRLDYGALAQRTLVGFSDLTALHLALHARTGASFVHGPVVTQLADLSPVDHEALVARLLDPDAPHALVGRPGSTAAEPVDGTLVGGCLALVSGLVGTRHLRWPDRTLLLLEEVAEAPYRVDRMMMQLELSGLVARLAGVALGAFERCDPPRDGEPSGLDVACARVARWGVPFVTRLPVGHGRENRAVRLGGPARLDVARGRLEVLPRGPRASAA